MGERALKWGLLLLGIFLTLAPFLIALGMHNWNIVEAVLPNQAEMAQVENALSGIMGGGFSGDTLTYGSPTINPDGTIEITIGFTSPFNIPIKINEISASVTDQGVQVAQIQMQEPEVEVPAMGTANLTLQGTYTGGIPTNPQLSAANITFEFYGISIQAQMSAGGP